MSNSIYINNNKCLFYRFFEDTLPTKIIHELIRLIFILLQYKRIIISFTIINSSFQAKCVNDKLLKMKHVL